VEGPAVVADRADCVYYISRSAATMRDLCESGDTAAIVRGAKGELVSSMEEILANTPEQTRDAGKPRLLAPNDLQAIKAAGVTFPLSMLERVIEEQARGAPEKAEAIRKSVQANLGGDIRTLVPGSAQAAELKRVLIEQGAWSQYLEVGIGPDAEIFTKGQPMSAVGHGMEAGLHPISTWNNPEPEVVLAVDPRGEVVGAMLGNDVNLRDFEGRSALLLSKAKDNTASCSLGPFIRLFDDDFTIDDVRRAIVDQTNEGPEGYRLEGTNDMGQISRDPLELVRQTTSEHHYPDGFVLFCGTLFAPTQDRDTPGGGFTHKVGDRVTIASRRLGRLVNTVTTSRDAPACECGIAAFARNLSERGMIDRI
jgi:fumarylacetoacetate (FAA) hydrolase family protein